MPLAGDYATGILFIDTDPNKVSIIFKIMVKKFPLSSFPPEFPILFVMGFNGYFLEPHVVTIQDIQKINLKSDSDIIFCSRARQKYAKICSQDLLKNVNLR